MASGRSTDQLVVIVGPTASGKSEAAMRVALEYKGEIICADSRTVYKGLDVGTAKPSTEDRTRVPHHLLDIVEVNQPFSAAEFQRLANAAVKNIRARGKLPIMVGGSGLFVDSVLFEYKFGAPQDPARRAELEVMDTEALQNYCKQHNIELPKNVRNKRHLVRAIEQKGVNHKRSQQQRRDTFVVGIAPNKELLQKRIIERSKRMFVEGAVIEAVEAAKNYGWDAPGLSGIIHPIIHQLVDGIISEQEAIVLCAKVDWRLARRQLTWFRRNKTIQWCESPGQAEQRIEAHLANAQ